MSVGRLCSQKTIQTSNVYGLETPPCTRMSCQHFTPPPPRTPTHTEDDPRESLWGCDPAAGTPTPHFPETRMSTGITCRPLFNLFFPPNEAQSTRDALAETATEQQGSPRLMLVGGRLISGWIWQPQCVCDPVALSCAVFDKRCSSARPDSVCRAASRAALWPISIGRFCLPSDGGLLGGYSCRNVGQLPSHPLPQGSSPSGEPEVQKQAHVDGILLVPLPLIVPEVSGGSSAGGWRAGGAASRLLSASLHPRPAATCSLTPTK